eukprot:m.74758 g.74758  ORF g.74758 m.74758 type:complete len:241 (+) comp18921_c0_seq1:196-918(+)
MASDSDDETRDIAIAAIVFGVLVVIVAVASFISWRRNQKAQNEAAAGTDFEDKRGAHTAYPHDDADDADVYARAKALSEMKPEPKRKSGPAPPPPPTDYHGDAVAIHGGGPSVVTKAPPPAPVPIRVADTGSSLEPPLQRLTPLGSRPRSHVSHVSDDSDLFGEASSHLIDARNHMMESISKAFDTLKASRKTTPLPGAVHDGANRHSQDLDDEDDQDTILPVQAQGGGIGRERSTISQA